MAIIRSKIARQLLAEGGQPRKRFYNGGFDEADVEAGLATESMSDYGYESGTAADPMGEAAGTTEMFSGGGGDPFIEASEVAYTGGPKGRQDPFQDSIQGYVTPKQTFLGNVRDSAGDIILGLVAPKAFIAKKAAEKLGFIDPNYVPDPNRFRREEDDDDDPPIILPKLRAPIEEKQKEPELTDFQRLLARAGARFEDGGDVRQEYGLGSIVKKAARAVKKVAKSDLGKAALIGAFTFGIPGVQTGFFSKGLMGTQKGLGFKKFLSDKILGKQFVDTGGEVFRFGGISPLTAILGTSLASGLFSKQQEDEDETLPAAVRSDPEIRKALEYRGLAFAQGGEVEDEMLNLGGKEMDLRGGGFVPLGEYEKKDDVPARLSKNEFVFTADAVRAAGGGSVDKGADVMYKTMKTLENKVA